MPNPTVVTGAASGLGAAVTRRLRSEGRTVLGVDVMPTRTPDDPLARVDVLADLGTPEGRRAAVDEVLARCDGRLDGVVSGAGVGPESPDTPAIVSVNWFGALFVLDELRSALAAGEQPAAVAISSIGAVMGGNDDLVETLRSGDEVAARATTLDSVTAYSSTKRALAFAVRERAASWGADGIRLNAVAPGRMRSPMLERIMATPSIASGVDALPSGVQPSGSPGEVGATVCFLLGPDAAFVHGQVLFVDGGAEAILRPDVL